LTDRDEAAEKWHDAAAGREPRACALTGPGEVGGRGATAAIEGRQQTRAWFFALWADAAEHEEIDQRDGLGPTLEADLEA